MNLDDLFSAIGTATEEQLEKSEKRPNRVLRVLIPVAACFCLILTALLIPSLHREPARRYISSETIDWYLPKMAEGEDNAFYMVSEYAAPYYQFMNALSVEARVLEVLPDVYSKLGTIGTSTRYHILHLQVLDTISGKNMPDEFYYLLPVNFDPNLTEYSSLIMTVYQLGYENYVMVNETLKRAEAFSFLFTYGSEVYATGYEPDMGGILAFRGNTLDTGLWEKAGWNQEDKEGTTANPDYLLSEKAPKYPGKFGRNLQQTKKAIRQQFYNEYKKIYQTKDHRSAGVKTYDSIHSAEAKAILSYVHPFENGVFLPDATSTYLDFGRWINGFQTNEVYHINLTDQSVQSRFHFTEEDLQQLPDTDSIIQSLSQDATRTDEKNGKELVFCGIRGRYQKTVNGIYCVLNRYWGDPSEKESRVPTCTLISSIKQTDTFIVLPDGTWREATEEDLEMLKDLWNIT